MRGLGLGEEQNEEVASDAPTEGMHKFTHVSLLLDNPGYDSDKATDLPPQHVGMITDLANGGKV